MFSQTTTDGKYGELHDQIAELGRYVQDAAREGAAAHVVERGIWDRVLEIGWQAFGYFLADQGDGDMGETFTLPDGRGVKRLEELHARSYQSIFGSYELNRAVYGTREGQKIEFVPLDHRLQLPESGYSHVLQSAAGGRPWAWNMRSRGLTKPSAGSWDSSNRLTAWSE